MADAKISALTELAEEPAATDEFVLVDKSDTTMAASGTDKRLRYDRLPTGASLPEGWAAPIGAVSPFISTASTAPGANNGRFMRIVIPRSGTLSSFTWYIGASSGNYKALIYDVGAASAGNYSQLYASGSTAVGTIDTWQTPLNPALAVTKGQHIMVGLVFDNGTATFGRNVAPGSAAMASLPAAMGGSPGSVVRVAMAGTVTFASVASTYSDASMAGLTAGPTILIKVT